MVLKVAQGAEAMATHRDLLRHSDKRSADTFLYFATLYFSILGQSTCRQLFTDHQMIILRMDLNLYLLQPRSEATKGLESRLCITGLDEKDLQI